MTMSTHQFTTPFFASGTESQKPNKALEGTSAEVSLLRFSETLQLSDNLGQSG